MFFEECRGNALKMLIRLGRKKGLINDGCHFYVSVDRVDLSAVMRASLGFPFWINLWCFMVFSTRHDRERESEKPKKREAKTTI